MIPSPDMGDACELQLTVNGVARTLLVHPMERLLDVLRATPCWKFHTDTAFAPVTTRPSNYPSERLICTKRSRASRRPVGVAASPPPAVSR